MSKSILVIDTPNECMECKLKYLDTGDDAYFGANVYRCVIDDSEVYRNMKDDYCPLRPLPDRVSPARFKDGTYYKAYDRGWNACIDEILGEEE